jgi:isovaleryl-CoA dehydrogenase
MLITDDFAAAVREVSARDVSAAAGTVDRDRRFPSEALESLARVGAMGLLVPVEYGGAGGGMAELAGACETIGGACASAGMVFLMHCVSCATLAAGGGAPAEKHLPAMAAGSELGSLAFSERGTGAHFYAPELRCVEDGDDLRITGHKRFVTSGGHADVYLILVRGGQEEQAELDCFALDGDAQGISFEGRWAGLGMAGNSSITMVLDGARVNGEDRVGAEGGGGELVFNVVAPVFLVGIAAVNVGIAASALAAACSHAAQRSYADGQTLAEVQAIQHALADMTVAVRAARGMVTEAATLCDDGASDALIAAMAGKVAATEAAEQVTSRALEVCGGQGYTPSLPVERHLRDARAGRVMAPTNGVLRNWIGKAAAGLPVP